MQATKPSRAQQKLWALLTIAFVIVGITAGGSLFKFSVDRYESDYRRELEGLASVAALAVDPRSHQALQHASQMNSPLYRRENQKLADIKARLKDIRYIYTISKDSKGYYFVLDPTPPGDHDHDGIDNKSYLGDPYPEMSDTAKQAFTSGSVTVEEEPIVDRWGTFVSAYAPIFNQSGEVIAILGLDRHAHEIADHKRDLQYMAIGGAATVVIAGLFFGWFFSRKMAKAKNNRGWLRYVVDSNLIFRATILEVILGCLAMIIFVGGLQSLSMQGKWAKERGESAREYRSLVEITGDLAQMPISEGRAKQIAENARSLNIPWVYQRIVRGTQDGDLSRILPQTVGELKAELKESERLQLWLQKRLEDGQRNMVVMFIASGLLALGALAIVRIGSIQQQDLVAAQTDSEFHQVAYRHVVENMPIGLFMIEGGRITFSNQHWEDLCQIDHESDRLELFLSKLTSAEKADFIRRLDLSEETTSSFDVNLTLNLGCEEHLSLDVRAIPLLNANREFECLLCFAVDVSQRVRNQEALKGRNREIQSKNRLLSEAVSLLEDNFEAMTQTLVKAVEAKDINTAGHSSRVMQYSLAIGRSLKLSSQDMKTLERGTLIHDIGKIGVPDEVLTKPSQLSEDEYKVIQAHSAHGAKMVENIPVFKDCVPIIRWHHERLNGTGYPDGLIGDEIPLLVRIAGVADVFDAITSNRAYRPAMNVQEATEVLRGMAKAGELDPELVEILTEIVLKDGVIGLSELSPAA